MERIKPELHYYINPLTRLDWDEVRKLNGINPDSEVNGVPAP